MRIRGTSGFSLVETLTALALMATVSAALLPAIAIASRLHRDSALQTDAAVVGAARLARLVEAVASASVGVGGSLEGPLDGWSDDVDAAGASARSGGSAVFEVRARVSSLADGSGVLLLAVRVLPLANRDAALTFTVVVPRA